MHVWFASVLMFVTLLTGCAAKPDAPKLNELQRTSSGNLDVVLLAADDALPAGKSQATIEFQARADHHLVDVGAVKASATMPMPGFSPMLGSMFVNRSDTPGRYMLEAD